VSAVPRPLPEPSGITIPFWEGTGRHELLIQHCRGCGRNQFYPRYNCTSCGAGEDELEWARASGRGTVFSFTVARRPTHPAFADKVPLVIALVDLEEGPRLTTNLVECDPDDVRIGQPVEVVFEDVGEGIALPLFRPA
jgi:uncharacterized OB-fold protein